MNDLHDAYEATIMKIEYSVKEQRNFPNMPFT
ncbi:hypothetical protein AciX8_1152 [Granulicella mallensis MP5ACTX8]|uniref:Uncharacterized protein n=1 Tax=Granulicella mallensis (strain ATCC BAA-1857 / DSM 23137 / MP5ACTX8) TaxID=682795 RepID=G8NWW9_GRAMM|nr:hypothetical protein AciX8_1152 [Granulicella mallensis MP5ACTX8]